MANVTMPQLGETVADGTVTKWFKKVGDVVEKGEPLFEVSTDKVDMEIPAQTNGVLSAILIEEGVTVDVGTTLAIIDTDPEDPLTSAPSVVAATPVSASSTVSSARDANETSHQLSPVVRRLLEEHQLRADQIVGSGPMGRLTRSDVENAISESVTSRGTTSSGDETIPFSKARRLTAEHMIRSKATSAHTLMVKEVDYEHVEEHRRHHGAAFKEREGYTLTYLPYVALAVLDALRAFPQINASVGNDELIVHHDLNLGIAVDLDGGGLVVPVIHNADRFDLWTMARQIRELASRARQKKLTVDDVTGGTFTITNPGPFGTFLTGAVINQPQIAILATDGVTRKPVVVTSPTGEESIVIHSAGLLALTFDHRAIDGAAAARFLNHVTAQLNGRDWIDEH
jgi:2-oxoglutarate dehydrogenase E2 component (dihydrolipoamide succinyltransferase)